MSKSSLLGIPPDMVHSRIPNLCLHSPVSRKRNQKLPMMALFVLFLLSPKLKLKMFPCTMIFDTNNTPTLVNSLSTIFGFLFFSTRRVLLDHFKGLFFFFVFCFLIYTRFHHWLDVITNGYCISIQSCRWTYERTALPYSFPDC